jgi:hypothetical protein
MKKISLIPFLFLVVMVSACNSGNTTAENVVTADTTAVISESGNSSVSQSLEHYLVLKDKLVESNAAEAKAAAAQVENSLKEVSGYEDAASMAAQIANTDEIAKQREIFSTLSDKMVDLLKSTKLEGKEVYVQFCPMANNNNGGYWLSAQEKIQNPYYGDAMLTCGVVKEVLN